MNPLSISVLKGRIVNQRAQSGCPAQILAMSIGSPDGSGVELMIVVMSGVARVVVAVMPAEMMEAVEVIALRVKVLCNVEIYWEAASRWM
jgi:hypothetical protein